MTDCRTCEYYQVTTIKEKPYTIKVQCQKGCGTYMMASGECPEYELWSEYFKEE